MIFSGFVVDWSVGASCHHLGQFSAFEVAQVIGGNPLPSKIGRSEQTFAAKQVKGLLAF
jgi:hypothetical protein